MKVELVTNLKRQAAKILADLHKSKEAVLITEHGEPSAYLMPRAKQKFITEMLEALIKQQKAS